ncbi:MAG: 3-deoxy-7-phosphoheptulonate synthase [Dehalococcoidia bacterium]
MRPRVSQQEPAVLVVSARATEAEVAHIVERIRESGHQAHISRGDSGTVVGVVGPDQPELDEMLASIPQVEAVHRLTKPYKLASRDFRREPSIIDLGYGVSVGGDELAVMAGPCSIEDEEHIFATAEAVKAAGANVLRGGAFKPRTSPYAFRGLGDEALVYLARAGRAFGMPVITELMSVRDLEAVAEQADVIQIGARNMQNFILLDEVGKLRKPVMLKRAPSGTIEEWLLAAEYILAQGNPDVILCERGIRTFESVAYRNTFDINAIPAIKELSHLPIIADPSHGTGKRALVLPVALAGVAAGADGLMIEVHPEPERALSDGPQSLTFPQFDQMMRSVSGIAASVGRTLSGVRASAEAR